MEMMKNFYKILLAIFISGSVLQAQNLKEPADFFNTVFKGTDKINSYYTGRNPAFLNLEVSDEMLSVKSVFTNEEGDFKRFIDPGTNRLYELSFTGKKSIDSLQVFKGSFGIQKIERKNWDQVFTKKIGNWNPFLLADASSGDAHFNGIVMNAAYSAIVFDKFSAGFNFNYSVDQGLKEIFPHPTSEHRDINLRVGAGYLLNTDYTIGCVLEASDNNERIEYRTDQEGVTRETILLKYRGYGAPLLFLKKSEERNSYQNSYASYLTFSAKCSDKLSSAFYLGGGIDQTSLSDDDNSPQSEGYFKNSFLKGGVNALLNVIEELNLGLYYDFTLNNYWAKHPRYDVLMMENYLPEHIIKAGIDYMLNKNIKAGFEAGMDLTKIDYKDYYSSVFWKASPTTLMLKIGTEIKFSNVFNTKIYLGYDNCNVGSKSFSATIDSVFAGLIAFRKNDIQFYQDNYSRFKVSFIPTVNLGQLGIVRLYFNYDLIKPEKANWPENAKRETFDAVLEFKLNVY